MPPAIGSVKEAFTSVTGHTAKIADLQKATLDTSKTTKGLTTDYGIFISDTDNWCVYLADR